MVLMDLFALKEFPFGILMAVLPNRQTVKIVKCILNRFIWFETLSEEEKILGWCFVILGYQMVNPHPDNTRVTAMKVFSQKPVIDSETWFGLEQEFFIRKSGLSNGDGPFYIKRFANPKRIYKGPIIVEWAKEIVIAENLWMKQLKIW